MFHEPKTKEEASKYRYGKWAGSPLGTEYKPLMCAAEVANGWIYKQCSKRAGYGPDGLYCSMHAKKLKKENSL